MVVLYITLGVFLVLCIYLIYSKWFVILLSKSLFGKARYRIPKNYDRINTKVITKFDISYKNHKRLKYDLFYPKEYEGKKLKVIISFPGGAYVGGSKRCNRTYNTVLASKGYVVFCVDYRLAPKYTYPNQLLDVSDFISYFKEKKYLELCSDLDLDFNNVFFAGDSAGAHLAINYLVSNIYSELEFRSLRSTRSKVNNLGKLKIKGLISFCGLISPQKLFNKPFFLWYIYKRCLKAIHHKNVKFKDILTKETSFVIYNEKYKPISTIIDKRFPNLFIVDCKKFSFNDQANDLIFLLDKNKITSFITDKDEYFHEFQFHLGDNDTYQQEIFESLLSFLEKGEHN